MQGHPGSKKTLYHLRQRYYSSNLDANVHAFIGNCQSCIWSKLIAKQQPRPPLQKIYDPINGLQDLLENDLVGPLPPSNSYTYILTAVNVFSKVMFAIPLRRPFAQWVVKSLILVFRRHVYIPNTIPADKGTAVTEKVVKMTMEQAGICLKQATFKRAQTIRLLERTHQKLKTIFKINISADQTQRVQ